MTEAASMAPRSGSREVRAGQAALAITLAAVAGFVDTAGFLTLHEVYTANMSGNTVQVGVDALGDTSGSALLHAYTIGTFLLGLLASGVVIELGLRHRFRRIFAAAMTLEVVCLGAFVVIGTGLLQGHGQTASEVRFGWPLYVAIALFTIAMGAQNTSLRMAGVLTVYTTHVTGAITKFAEDTVQYLFARLDRRRAAGQPQVAGGSKQAPSLAIVLLSAGLWLGFLGGAVLAGYAVPRHGLLVLLAPIATVAAIGVIDCIRPLAAIEARGAPARPEGRAARPVPGDPPAETGS